MGEAKRRRAATCPVEQAPNLPGYLRLTMLDDDDVGCTVYVEAGTPAYAAGAKSEAKEECTDLLQDKGYKGVDIDQAKKRGDDKVAVQADANRKGSEHDVTCVYNEDTDKARIKK